MLEYHLSEAADQDLDQIFDYTKDKHGENQAVSYLLSFEKIFKTLSSNPALGRTRLEIKRGLRSISNGEHVVFYRVMRNSIRIVRVLHGSRDLPKFLE